MLYFGYELNKQYSHNQGNYFMTYISLACNYYIEDEENLEASDDIVACLSLGKILERYHYSYYLLYKFCILGTMLQLRHIILNIL